MACERVPKAAQVRKCQIYSLVDSNMAASVNLYHGGLLLYSYHTSLVLLRGAAFHMLQPSPLHDPAAENMAWYAVHLACYQGHGLGAVQSCRL